MLATNNTTLAGTTEDSMTTPKNANIYSYGNYYNWYSATAGRGTYDMTSSNAVGDICPAGWQLPIGSKTTVTKSFGALSVALGGPEGGAGANSSSTPTGAVMSKTFRSYPNNFVYSGHGTGNRGSFGYYWSSSVSITYSSGAYVLYLSSISINPGTTNLTKHAGRSVRCLAQ